MTLAFLMAGCMGRCPEVSFDPMTSAEEAWGVAYDDYCTEALCDDGATFAAHYRGGDTNAFVWLDCNGSGACEPSRRDDVGYYCVSRLRWETWLDEECVGCRAWEDEPDNILACVGDAPAVGAYCRE